MEEALSLLYVCAEGTLEKVKEVMAENIDLHETDNRGRTGLLYEDCSF